MAGMDSEQFLASVASLELETGDHSRASFERHLGAGFVDDNLMDVSEGRERSTEGRLKMQLDHYLRTFLDTDKSEVFLRAFGHIKKYSPQGRDELIAGFVDEMYVDVLKMWEASLRKMDTSKLRPEHVHAAFNILAEQITYQSAEKFLAIFNIRIDAERRAMQVSDRGIWYMTHGGLSRIEGVEDMTPKERRLALMDVMLDGAYVPEDERSYTVDGVSPELAKEGLFFETFRECWKKKYPLGMVAIDFEGLNSNPDQHNPTWVLRNMADMLKRYAEMFGEKFRMSHLSDSGFLLFVEDLDHARAIYYLSEFYKEVQAGNFSRRLDYKLNPQISLRTISRAEMLSDDFMSVQLEGQKDKEFSGKALLEFFNEHVKSMLDALLDDLEGLNSFDPDGFGIVSNGRMYVRDDLESDYNVQLAGVLESAALGNEDSIRILEAIRAQFSRLSSGAQSLRLVNVNDLDALRLGLDGQLFRADRVVENEFPPGDVDGNVEKALRDLDVARAAAAAAPSFDDLPGLDPQRAIDTQVVNEDELTGATRVRGDSAIEDMTPFVVEVRDGELGPDDVTDVNHSPDFNNGDTDRVVATFAEDGDTGEADMSSYRSVVAASADEGDTNRVDHRSYASHVAASIEEGDTDQIAVDPVLLGISASGSDGSSVDETAQVVHDPANTDDTPPHGSTVDTDPGILERLARLKKGGFKEKVPVVAGSDLEATVYSESGSSVPSRPPGEYSVDAEDTHQTPRSDVLGGTVTADVPAVSNTERNRRKRARRSARKGKNRK